MDAIEAHGRSGSELRPQASTRERALYPYAAILTHTPAKVREDSIIAMREAGLDDVAILEANQVIAYFAYVNRVVDGLGVTLEPHRRNG